MEQLRGRVDKIRGKFGGKRKKRAETIPAPAGVVNN
jgi:hypothetical protein